MNTKTPPKPKWPAAEAIKVGKSIRDILSPFCEKIVIAGSLRRERSHVSDIELLFIPKLAPDPSSMMGALFGQGDAQMQDLAEIAINRLVQDGVLAKRPNANGSPVWGPLNKLAVHVESGIPIDFFTTTQEKWWVSLVIRTGGKRTNLALTMGANKIGLRLNAYGTGFTRMSDGEKIACNSEAEVFHIAGVRYTDPKYRK